MKITITSDDGKKVANVNADDIDVAGHTLNMAVLDLRFEAAVFEVAKYEIKLYEELEQTE